MDRAKFYAALRAAKLFGKSLPKPAFEGIERLLNVQARYLPDMKVDELSIGLSTSFHETGGTMQPITERGTKAYFNKYEPGTKLGKVLGNTVKGDGYRFRGEGDVQNTGRRNAKRATDRLNELFNLGIDLVKNPEMRGDPLISALSLFIGCREGWWTGKGWGDFLDGVDEDDDEDLREFIASRRVVNGTDKAEKIGRYALVFEACLKLAGFAPVAAVTAPAAKVYRDRTTVEVVQRKLYDFGYTEVGSRRPDGTFDGDLGTMTETALLAFRKDNGLPLVPAIDDALLAAIDTAKPRKIAHARENADAATVREKVPEARASWWSRMGAAVIGVPGLIVAAGDGILDNIKSASEALEPVKDVAASVPPWGWGLIVAGAAFAIWRTAKAAENASVEAFQTGARR